MITLILGEKKVKFSAEQATSILLIQQKMKTRKGYALPDDSPYEWKDNALIKRRNPSTCKDEAQKGSTGKGKASRKQAEVSHGDDPAKD